MTLTSRVTRSAPTTTSKYTTVTRTKTTVWVRSVVTAFRMTFQPAAITCLSRSTPMLRSPDPDSLPDTEQVTFKSHDCVKPLNICLYLIKQTSEVQLAWRYDIYPTQEWEGDAVWRLLVCFGITWYIIPHTHVSCKGLCFICANMFLKMFIILFLFDL